LKVSYPPESSIATQNVLEAQDTAVWLAGGTGSISAGLLQLVPLNRYTLPPLSMATQKRLVGHDTESGEPAYLLITVGLLHCVPLTVYIVPASSSLLLATAQNLVVGHETAASLSDEPIGVSALQVGAADALPADALPAVSATATPTPRRRAMSAYGRRESSINAGYISLPPRLAALLTRVDRLHSELSSNWRLRLGRLASMVRRVGLIATAVAVASLLAVSMSAVAAQPAIKTVVGCGDVIGQQVSGASDGGRVVLGLASVPPPRIQRAATTGVSSWKYFSKWGMAIRSGASVTVSVPTAWRSRVAITWGSSTPIVSTLRFAVCRSAGGKKQPWNAYPGGFYLDTPTACVPLTFTAGHRSRTVRFGIGKSC
jgi:hypothetical protein